MKHNTESLQAFETAIPVQVSHINYGNHVGFDSMVSLIHEAQMRFFKNYGFTEININGLAIVVRKLEVKYKKEVFYGENLQFSINIGEKTQAGLDLLFSVKNSDGQNVCEAITTLVFVDPDKKKIVKRPEIF